ncbi:MAG: ubiquinone/menaquinone biosynthesis methyltransferase [Chloroflexi bacterium]|nr:ubiquinone/menaquinone biosynthesis methyltransferase [Chloroflexota bacterium]
MQPRAPEQPVVEAMFDGIVDRYDLLNHLMSLGLDRRWRARAVAALGPLPPGARVLDLGCGSGDLCLALARQGIAPVGLDVSQSMLDLAARRLSSSPAEAVEGRVRVPAISLVRASAFQLPFPDGAFAGAISGFVLRNLRDLDGAFRELSRVLAPGARVALLDATEPPNPVIRRLFDTYFGVAAPALGALFGHRQAYAYLVRSLAHLPARPEMCRMLQSAGLTQAHAEPLDFGAVTLFTARKPH